MSHQRSTDQLHFDRSQKGWLTRKKIMKLGPYVRLVALTAVLVNGFLMLTHQAYAQNSLGERQPATLTSRDVGRSDAPGPTNHILKGTIFDTTSPGAAASCSSANCSAYAPIYVENVPCPAAAGATCTFQITIQSQNVAGSNDGKLGEQGEYQFFVDGTPPTPGPVDSSCACYTWSGSSHLFSLSVRAVSYAVTATVTNTTSKQSHSIAVNLGCIEGHGNKSGFLQTPDSPI
jgi:hypothetical protein